MKRDRVTFTVRMDRAEYDALQTLYYATAVQHRSSFNAWIVMLIASALEYRAR